MGFLSIFDRLIFLKLIIFMYKIPANLKKEEEKKRALKIVSQVCGKLLPASIRHDIHFKPYSAMYSISKLPPSNLK